MITELKQRASDWFFRPPVRLFDGNQAKEDASGGHRGTVWVVPRARLVHKVFSLPAGLSGSQRVSALHLQVKAWAPFGNCGYAVQWSANKASVFAWDADQIGNQINEKLGVREKVEICPEPFIASPIENGSRLLSGISGVEGQVWKNGFLEQSRWWPVQPEKPAVSIFLRSAGQPEQNVRLQEPDFLDRPWHKDTSTGDQLVTVASDRAVTRGLAAAFGLVFIFLVVQWMTLSIAGSLLSSELSDLGDATDLVRDQRRQAITALADANGFLSLQDEPHQLDLYLAVGELLTNNETKILNWTYTPGRLSVVLTADAPLDPTYYIRRLEALDLFTDVVTSTVGRDQDLRIDMVISRPADDGLPT